MTESKDAKDSKKEAAHNASLPTPAAPRDSTTVKKISCILPPTLPLHTLKILDLKIRAKKVVK